MTVPIASMHDVPTLPELSGAVIGGVLVGYGRERSGARGAIARIAGAGLVAAALARTLVAGVRTAGQRRRTIRLRRTLHVAEPVREVFAFCKDFENFPRIIGSLRRVIDYEDGRSHWEVSSPSGELLEWNAVVTKYVPNMVIAWRSVAGSPVESSGTVRFAPAADGGTTLDVQITYVPNETTLGDALLAIVDSPRQTQVEHDIERADAYLASSVATTDDTPAAAEVHDAPATVDHAEPMSA